MGGILDWLGLSGILGGGGGMTQQVMKPGSDPAVGPAPAAVQPTAMQAGDASTSAGGAKPSALNETMMKLLMASILANPTAPVQPPGGGPAPIRGQPFQYSPTSAMAVGPRARL